MQIQVYLNDKAGRRKVFAELVKRNEKSVWVRLEGGRIIKRKVPRDVV